jgi:cob(I)alamin adenosyltransferase
LEISSFLCRILYAHIYKNRDNGETGVIGGRLSKIITLFDLVGGLDELNASIGVVSSLLIRENNLQSEKQKEESEEKSKEESIEKDIDVLIKDLLTIQSHIFELGTLQ